MLRVESDVRDEFGNSGETLDLAVLTGDGRTSSTSPVMDVQPFINSNADLKWDSRISPLQLTLREPDAATGRWLRSGCLSQVRK
jgi:hypothetical protein